MDIRFDGFRIRRTDQAGLWENVFRLKRCNGVRFRRTVVEGFDHLPPDAQNPIGESTNVVLEPQEE